MDYDLYQAREEAERERIAEYLDGHARSMEDYSRTDDTSESIRTRKQGAALLRESVRLIRDGAHLRGEG